jgi:enhancing lycopene biosynthesis protein 2
MRTRKLINCQVIVSAFSNCLSLHSQRNTLLKRLFGLFLYASGAQRQVLTVLNHIGVAESYSNLTAKLSSARKTPGTLQRLSQTLRERARNLAKTGIFGEVYDNINFAEKVGEQVIGRTST